MRGKLSYFGCAVALAFVSGNASANEAGEIDVEPGLYNWSHTTTLAGQSFSEENTECLPPEKARFSLQDIADEIGQGCSMSDIIPHEDGYLFQLSCTGIYSGKADGQITKYSADSIGMTAVGKVTLGQLEADFEFDSKAQKVGDCG